MTVQPFKKRERINSMEYSAVFVSDTRLKVLEDRERYDTFVSICPWNKLVEFKCSCKGFKFAMGKKFCKHISKESPVNPGLLQILRDWNEIHEIPEVENET